MTFLALSLFLLASSSPFAKANNAAVPPPDENNEQQQICKSNAAGVMTCKAPSEWGDEGGGASSSSATISADGSQQLNPDDAVNNAANIFQCQDLSEECPNWAKYDKSQSCTLNSAYMTQYCPLSCQTCEDVYLGHRLSTMLEGGLAIIPFCQDNDFSCRQYAMAGECEKNPEYMTMMCEASCGICSEESNKFGVGQKLYKDEPSKSKPIRQNLQETIDYMKMVKRNRLYKNVRSDCLNKVPDCAFWSSMGECEKNEQYMKVLCAPSCKSCDYLGDTSETCPGLPESNGPLWKEPGDVNKFFETIVDNLDGNGEFYAKFNPKALSRPNVKADGTPAPTTDGTKDDGPWIVLLENFLSSEEADRLVNIGHTQGFERSLKTIDANVAETTDGRTSTNTWCKDSCMSDPVVAGVLERIAATTKSTIRHSEHLQLLRYEPGQFYGQHHDYIPYQLDQPCGARIMTLFLYLNDVEEGGNTSFPELKNNKISVSPKKGSALLWPSVLDEDPMEKDGRTDHEAEVVVRGVKYGANAWIHSEDFQTPLGMGCMV